MRENQLSMFVCMRKVLTRPYWVSYLLLSKWNVGWGYKITFSHSVFSRVKDQRCSLNLRQNRFDFTPTRWSLIFRENNTLPSQLRPAKGAMHLQIYAIAFCWESTKEGLEYNSTAFISLCRKYVSMHVPPCRQGCDKQELSTKRK